MVSRLVRPTLATFLLTGSLTGWQPLEAQEPRQFRWQEGVTMLSVVVISSLADQPIQRYTQDNQTSFQDDLASTFRHMGQPEVFLTAGLGTIGVGLVTHNAKVARAGGRITASVLLAGAATTGLKFLVGRVRPSDSENAYLFHPFSGNESFPSGHATVAFALAASASDEIHRVWATVPLYTAAGLCGWSRVYNNAHWFSDVLAAAAVGVTSAKLVNGRWRVWHIRPPAIIREPDGQVGLVWHGEF